MKTKNTGGFPEGAGCDNSPDVCRADDKVLTLPRHACLPINRCNLPAVILGSLSYQLCPVPLQLDGVAELHQDLFLRLQDCPEAGRRAEIFRDYMTVHFRLEHLDEAGFSGGPRGRAKANYVRMLRGWSFDSGSREAAVLKGWVESRFGLLPRYHCEALRDKEGSAYLRFMEMRARGLYGTNALESQLDLVYAYCQYEFARQQPGVSHLTLYRGTNHRDEYECLGEGPGGGPVLLLNSLNSFSSNRERAGEFGDYILVANVPVAKVIFHSALLPGVLQGEDERLVLGGAYEVAWTTF